MKIKVTKEATDPTITIESDCATIRIRPADLYATDVLLLNVIVDRGTFVVEELP